MVWVAGETDKGRSAVKLQHRHEAWNVRKVQGFFICG